MADRYWVGGTASWDGTAGTKWSLTSGGAGGETVPTTADDVFFSVLSTGTCTIASGNTGAKSIDCTGFTGTIAGSASITVAGSITLNAVMGYTHTGTKTITGTGTLITAGKAFSGVTINGSGITVTLGDAISVSGGNGTLEVTQGTFDTASYSVTGNTFNTTAGTAVKTVNLNASTLTIGFTVSISGSSLTFNAGTSQLNLSAATATFAGGGKTFYNVTFTNSATGIRSITFANTFNNLTLNAIGNGLSELSINSNQTVNGTLTCAGSSATARGFVRSFTFGTAQTITCAAVSANDCDFRDITIAGAAAPISPTRGGDCGGNSGITFPAAKNSYRVGTNTTWAGSSSWALTSGGTGDNNNFPLAQDTAIVDNSTTLTGTLSLAVSYNIGSFDSSTRTTGILYNFNVTASVYGSYTFGSGVSIAGTSGQTFAGRGTQTFTSAGKTITFAITVDKPAGAFELGDAYNSSNTITHTRGTFDAKTYNLTCTTFTSTNSNVRTITMGSGLWTLSGTGTVWTTNTTTNLTLNKNTADILLSNTSTSTRSFQGGAGISFNKLTIGGATGTSILTLVSGTLAELASTKTVAHTVRFSLSGSVVIDTWSVTGTAGNLVTVDSSVLSIRRTFTLTNITSGIDYLSVKDIGITSPNLFYVGNNSVDGGNNLNVYFTAAPGGGYVISANNGTYAVTGQAATITKSRLLLGDFGVYTVAGQSATISKSILLSGNFGTYTVTGEQATIVVSGSPIIVTIEETLIKIRSFTTPRRI